MNSLLKSLATALVVLTVTRAVQADSQVYQGMVRSTAWVLTPKGSGTGALVDRTRRLVVTNYHVVEDMSEIMVCFPRFQGGTLIAERKHYLENMPKLGIRGRVVAQDPGRDLALIELASVPDDAEALVLAASSPNPGEQVHSIGNP